MHEKPKQGESHTFKPSFENGEKPVPTETAEDADLNVELSLPPVELYVPSDEKDVDATFGWRGVGTTFNPETGRMETTVEKNGVQKVFPTEELDELQLEMYRAITAPQREIGDKGLRAAGIEKPELQSRAKITVIRDAQGPEKQ